ncbi:TetR/AcrR family transcriptional regulator [Mycobacterium sp. NPDC006124]|uniref:TetR/AcrR family transcriptional regulator n=1 Tax=Mycobacterium sp. NPDC006124 TaxID=3156729 RepID=UPI0033BF0007
MTDRRPTTAVRPQRAQQERSRIAKQRILDATVRVLVDHGYANTTTLRIQDEAQVSRGGLLNHFPSRDALVVAAVQHLATERIQALGSRTSWPEDLADRVDEAVDAMWATYSQSYFWASVELWVASRTKPELREALRPAEHTTGEMVRTFTDAFFGTTLTARPSYPMVRELLNTSMRGVALTYAFEPRDPSRDPHLATWKSVAANLLLTAD